MDSHPPGLDVDASFIVVSDGGEAEWLHYDKVKLYTNAFIKQNGKLLLGYKKRGFGKNLYNGFGGKVDPGETPAEAAVRELHEEAGITAQLVHRGILFFVSSDSEHAFHIDIFAAGEYTGVITETEEMRPEWFATCDVSSKPQAVASDNISSRECSELSHIPFDRMWADDIFWMPLLLADRHFVGRVDFGADRRLRRWWFAAGPETK